MEGGGPKILVEWNREPRNECGHLHFRICGGAESDFLFSPYNTYVPLCFMQGFVNFGDADIPLSAHLIPPMCHGLIQIQFFLPTCLTTQRRARCFSPEERNNVFDKRGPFRFHIPVLPGGPTYQPGEFYNSSLSFSISHSLSPARACRYCGESQEWCISSRAGWLVLVAPTSISTCRLLIPFRSAFSCIFMACNQGVAIRPQGQNLTPRIQFDSSGVSRAPLQ